jgi:hypothetical protein
LTISIETRLTRRVITPPLGCPPAARLTPQLALSDIAEDMENPCLKAGTPFEVGQCLEHRKPGLLHHLFGHSLTNEGTSKLQHLALVSPDCQGEGMLVMGEQLPH